MAATTTTANGGNAVRAPLSQSCTEHKNVGADADWRKVAKESMPSEAEMEEFFAAAESGVAQRFAAKYNYDVVEDAPMDGRYEWVRL